VPSTAGIMGAHEPNQYALRLALWKLRYCTHRDGRSISGRKSQDQFFELLSLHCIAFKYFDSKGFFKFRKQSVTRSCIWWAGRLSLLLSFSVITTDPRSILNIQRERGMHAHMRTVFFLLPCVISHETNLDEPCLNPNSSVRNSYPFSHFTNSQSSVTSHYITHLIYQFTSTSWRVMMPVTFTGH